MTRSFWGKFRQPEEGKTGAEGQPPPVVRSIPLGSLVDLVPLPKDGVDLRNPRKFDTALILGLGPTGSQIIRAFVRRLEQDPAGYQEILRPIILTLTPEEEIKSTAVYVRQFDLLSRMPQVSQGRGRYGSRRAYTDALFRDPAVFTPFSNYLNAAVTELASEEGHGGTIRVFIVASAMEQEIGMLGPVLQMLRLMQSRGDRPLANFTLLLSLWSPHQSLDAKEMFATMREIGRFTFSGSWHWLPDLPLREKRRNSVKDALVDYVFLVEASGGRNSRVDLRSLPFEQGVGQVMTDTLYLLLHPAGHALWENVRNDLAFTSRLQSETRRPFVHSLAIATLYIPVSEIQDYEAARLAYAALFGEQEILEGLLPQVKLRRSLSAHTPGQEARRWLRERHPLFRWLLEAQDPRQIRQLPSLDASYYEEFAKLLPSDVAYGLVDLLNDPQHVDHLDRARSELFWLIQRIKEIESLLETENIRPAETCYLITDLLAEWQISLTNLLDQVENWKRTLLTGVSESMSQPSSRRITEPTAFADDIFGGISIASVGKSQSSEQPRPSNKNHQIIGNSVYQRLKARRLEAEAVLAAISSNPIRQSLTADGDRGVEEVAQHYVDTIRPELRRRDEHNDSRFERIRERLRWWVDTQESIMQLLLLCVPPDLPAITSSGELSRAVQFRSQDGDALYETVLALAYNQVQDVENHLKRDWMDERLQDRQFHKFLQTADRPFLAYDQVQSNGISPLAATSRRYLIGSSKTTTDFQKKMAFPNVAASEVNTLEDSSATYLTALGLTINIPIESINTIKTAERDYGYSSDLHIYPQEKIAAGYESLLHTVRIPTYQFPPELILPFTDQRLVSLFCQAVFHGLISIQSPDYIAGRRNALRYWVLPSFDNSSEYAEDEIDDLRLHILESPEDEKYRDQRWMSLYLSMRTFTLDARLESSRNPAHPLHPNNYVAYTNQLFEATKEARRNAQESLQLRQIFEEQYLEPWRRQTGSDLLGRSFLDFLQLELKRPLWRGW
jgi:hypothetical protein